VDEIVTVREQDVLDAMRYAMLETKLLLEPTGALALAALLSGAVTAGGPIALVASGGNADPALLAAVLGGAR
jgi:threonine dehydratase